MNMDYVEDALRISVEHYSEYHPEEKDELESQLDSILESLRDNKFNIYLLNLEDAVEFYLSEFKGLNSEGCHYDYVKKHWDALNNHEFDK